jgi:hypothetical protein
MSIRNQFIADHAADARWFLALKAIRRPLLLHSLSIDSAVLAQEKEKVFTTESYNPSFVYPHLQVELVRTALDQLLKLQTLVYQEEVDSSIRTLYTERLAEMILEQELLLASATGEYTTFTAKNLALYGEMHPSYVAEHLHTLQSRYHIFESFSVHETERTVLPTPADFARAQSLITGPDITVMPGTMYSSEMIVSAWNAELETAMPGWKAVIDSTVVHMLVDHRRRTVHVPAGIFMRAKKMRKLFVHEIGTHVYRREQGKRSRLQLASIGMAGYQIAEEGLAIMRAQLTAKRFYHFGGLDKYLVLALATGALDGVPKDFAETFRLLELYYSARLERVGKSDLIPRVAKNRAWNSTLRVFRGGNPTLPGCCFMRDKMYHEGNRMMWGLVETHPEYFSTLLSAKYNPQHTIEREAVVQFAIS